MDGSAVARSASLGLLGFHDRVDDGALRLDGTLQRGQQVVHDVAVSFEVKLLDAGGRVCPAHGAGGRVRGLRAHLRGDEEARSISSAAGRRGNRWSTSSTGGRRSPSKWVPVRFSNIDNLLRFEFGDQSWSSTTTTAATPSIRDPPSTLGAISLGERVRLGGEGVVLRVRNIRVERDCHISSRGAFGTGAPLQLGPDEVFVVGDATAVSEGTARDRGPVSRSRIFDRVEAIVWPPQQGQVVALIARADPGGRWPISLPEIPWNPTALRRFHHHVMTPPKDRAQPPHGEGVPEKRTDRGAGSSWWPGQQGRPGVP